MKKNIGIIMGLMLSNLQLEAMNSLTMKDMALLYTKGEDFTSYTCKKPKEYLTVLNAHAGYSGANFVWGNPTEKALDKVEKEFDNDGHVWLLPEYDGEWQKKLEDTKKYEKACHVSEMEWSVAEPDMKHFIESMRKKITGQQKEFDITFQEVTLYKHFNEFVTTQAKVFPEVPEQSHRIFMSNILRDNGNTIYAYLAYHKKQPIAGVFVHNRQKDVMSVFNLGVLKEFRNKGVARALLLHAYDTCKRPDTLEKVVGIAYEPKFYEQFKAVEVAKLTMYTRKKHEPTIDDLIVQETEKILLHPNMQKLVQSEKQNLSQEEKENILSELQEISKQFNQ